MSDFEVTNGEEEDIFTEKEDNVVREAREETNKRFRTWDKASTSKDGGDPINDLDVESDDSETFHSMDSEEEEEEDEGEGPHRRVRRYPEWRPKRDLKEIITLTVGLKFSNPTEFKETLKVFAVQNSFDYMYKHNEKTRVSAECKKKCGWRIHATTTIHKQAIVRWVVNRYIDSFRDQINLKPTYLREMIWRDYHVEFKMLSCLRAKRMALEILDGIDGEQYKHTREYANALLQWNLGSLAFIQRDGVFFQRIMFRWRPARKGKWSGQLHAAVARDANDDIYPIAYAICEAETRDTWTWFLKILLDDIGYDREHMWSFMSDRQKGLVNALEDLMPGAEHMYCVKHLHANLKKRGFKGKEFKDALWGAARALNEIQFKYYLEVIKGMDQRAYKYLEKINPKVWSRHAFFTTNCNDILLNNIAKSFNAWVLEARDQPILSCMKTIRRQLMNQFDKKRVGVATSTNYEVDHSHEPRRVVNLEARTCGCGRWQLNGILCPHAICAMYRNRRFPEDYISKWYLMDTYRLSYAPNINPMPGPNDWLIDCDVDPIEPPIPKTQRGRPKKLRRRGDDETVPDESTRVT
ncbi:uncharacterized protein LOC133859491 [Alnus glutinosa]|uniref:uncharacterized protein LOC133859491 n=1 Tax=Alnus glutinosa TaxID=3517 RepID=UPI002D77EDC7|nr:uncharacterized protein LOC133859491 [Alnus glutinosa]